MGGSSFYRYLDLECSRVPDVNLKVSRKTMEGILELNSEGHTVSVHDLSEGGLGVGISEMCIGGHIGAMIDIKRIGEGLRNEEKLFSESNSRYLLEVPVQFALKVEDTLSRHEIPYSKIGTVGGSTLKITCGEEVLSDIPVDILDHKWRNGLKDAMEGSS
jgi:phosphoribosylformylglycinamidine synthase